MDVQNAVLFFNDHFGSGRETELLPENARDEKSAGWFYF